MTHFVTLALSLPSLYLIYAMRRLSVSCFLKHHGTVLQP